MTALEDFNTFLTAQQEADYVLGDIEGTPEEDMVKYTELKVATAQETKKVSAFNDNKALAFTALETTQDIEKQALGTLWQSYEDNDYTIPN